jgi:hypothetical protein
MKTVYLLRNNKTYIKLVQEASLHREDLGLRITHGLFGSEEWWSKIESRELPLITIEGSITRVFMSGMNDWPEFEMVTPEGELSRWTREVDGRELDRYYRPGARVEIDYVIQHFKRDLGAGLDSKCVIEIRVDELDDAS